MKQTLKRTSFFFNFLLAEKALYFLYNVETNLQVDLRKSRKYDFLGGYFKAQTNERWHSLLEVRILIS